MRFIFALFIIFCFFPFLNVLRVIPTDSQPNALLIAVPVVLLTSFKRIPLPFLLCFVVLLFSILISPLYGLGFNTFRSVITYISIFFIPLATYKLLKQYDGLPYYLLWLGVGAWFIVGFMQTYVAPEFGTFLLKRAITFAHQGRGVIGLSNEPSFYGAMCLLFMIIALLNFPMKKINLLLFLCLVQLLMFAKSSMALLTLIISLGVLVVTSLNIRLFIGAGIVTLLAAGIIINTKESWENTRMYNLGNKLIDNPALFIAADQSVNARFINTLLPIKSLVDNNLKPGGYGQFMNYVNNLELSPEYEILLKYREALPSDGAKARIKSGFGAPFFELGGIGLLVPIAIFLAFSALLKEPKTRFAYILYNLLLFSAVVFNTATLGFIIGNAAFITWKKNKLDRR